MRMTKVFDISLGGADKETDDKQCGMMNDTATARFLIHYSASLIHNLPFILSLRQRFDIDQQAELSYLLHAQQKLHAH